MDDNNTAWLMLSPGGVAIALPLEKAAELLKHARIFSETYTAEGYKYKPNTNGIPCKLMSGADISLIEARAKMDVT